MQKIKLISPILIAFILIQNIPTTLAQNQNLNLQKIPPHQTSGELKYKEGEVIVKYKKDKINLKKNSGQEKAKSFESTKGLQKLDSVKDFNIELYKSDKKTSVIINDLKNDPNVEYAEPNLIRKTLSLPNDPGFTEQWALNNTGQLFHTSPTTTTTGTADADIDAPEAWSLENPSNTQITVAVIDTGARFTHEDLGANMWDGTDCKDDNNVTISGGCPNHGWDYKDNDNNPDDTKFCYYGTNPDTSCIVVDGEGDVSGHGTFISGIIGGVQNNSKGISGISSQNKIKVMPVRFDLDLASELKAISFAKNNGAKIINASFGGTVYSQAEKDAIDAFPGIVVAAAGNDGTNNDSAHFYPSDYASSNIISVASTDQNDALSSFSNFSSILVDLAAPGQSITSTYNTADNAYAVGSGTSFAAPYVAASTALLFSANSNLSLTQVKNKILSSGDSLSSLSGKTVSGKRLNLNNSLQSALKADSPTVSLSGGSYTSTQTVTLSTATSGANIYYTLDGSTPTASSNLYSTALSISATTTLKAITIKSGLTDSDIFSATYTINLPVVAAAPTTEQLKAADYDYYQKYDGYLKYQKYKDYQKYKKAKDKYGFDSPAEKSKAKLAYNNYKLFLKNPIRYKQYITSLNEYRKYKKYASNVSPLSKYSSNSKYSKYSSYKNYSGSEYKAAYERYLSY